MIIERALRLAGPGAHLVARPAGRIHVYTGPLTRSGRFVPRGARALCRAHTRRLKVIDDWIPPVSSSLDPRRSLQVGVCARCSARLSLRQGRAEQHLPRTRAEFRETYAELTKGDVAAALEMASTAGEVDAAAHLSLVLFDVAGCLVPFTDRGRTWPPLQQLVNAARDRVDGFPPERQATRDRLHAISIMSRAQAAEERRQVRAEREAKIARLGIGLAFPDPKPTRGSRTRGARP